MKRFISIISAILLLSSAVFAEDDYDGGDFYDDDYVYEQNGAGDQFLKIDIAANFPLNFGDKLYVGLGASVGYSYFLNKYVAVGGDAIIGWNNSLGQKPLITVPVTFGVTVQPYIGKFEFPISVGIGFATISCQNLTYFPGFSAKISAGAYFRFNETWSLGIDSIGYWLPQWFMSDSSKIDNGFFATLGLSLRYHF